MHPIFWILLGGFVFSVALIGVIIYNTRLGRLAECDPLEEHTTDLDAGVHPVAKMFPAKRKLIFFRRFSDIDKRKYAACRIINTQSLEEDIDWFCKTPGAVLYASNVWLTGWRLPMDENEVDVEFIGEGWTEEAKKQGAFRLKKSTTRRDWPLPHERRARVYQTEHDMLPNIMLAQSLTQQRMQQPFSSDDGTASRVDDFQPGGGSFGGGGASGDWGSSSSSSGGDSSSCSSSPGDSNSCSSSPGDSSSSCSSGGE